MSKFRNEGLGKEPHAPSAGDPRAKESISIQRKTCQQEGRDNGGRVSGSPSPCFCWKMWQESFSHVAHGGVFFVCVTIFYKDPEYLAVILRPVHSFLVSFMEMEVPSGQSLGYLQQGIHSPQAQCLELNRDMINVYWMNEQLREDSGFKMSMVPT